ncbi:MULTISPECIES: TetR/AcrR family transcriptional regulator [unclassified Bradyrhizobium]|uniref:TetR/AcrR family transcriptional regulator n=1 Tax=unclassified Bradyrhizobium TaxID=2631580 RepID=UPI002916A07C|nr:MULTISPECIES: TetR/AcrR family transcriptional regulator [unclassified Bradyrhizobium]
MSQRIAPEHLPGVTPSRQQRSRETTLALLTAGAELLRTRSLAELSISDLCAHIGATVGAFYSRFDSKEAFFNALLALTLADGRKQLSRLPPPDPVRAGDLQCQLLVRGTVLWMRRHKGVLRAALVRSEPGPNHWSGFKELAQALSERAALLLLPAGRRAGAASRTRSRTAEARKTVAFGVQVVLGTLVNAILNDPGPLSIDDDEIAERLGACLVLLLRAGPDGAPRKPQAARGER